MNRIIIALVMSGIGGGIVGAYVAGREQRAEITLEQASVRNQRAPKGMKIVKNERSKEAFDFDLLTRIPQSSRDMEMLDDYCAGLTAKQLAEVIRKLKTLPVENKMTLIQMLLLTLAEKDPRLALEESQRLKTRIDGIFEIWASKNPEEAAAYYVKNRAQLSIDDARGIAKQWGAVNREAAWSWAATLTSGDQVNAREALMEMLIKSDFDLAVAKFKSLPAEEQVRKTQIFSNQTLYTKLVNEWLTKDKNAVKEWIKTLPAGVQKETFKEVVNAFSFNEPEQAMAWMLEDLNKEDHDSLFTVGDVMRNWQSKDTAAVRQWIRKQPDGDWKNILVQQYAYNGNPSQNFRQDIAFVEEMGLPQNKRQEALSNLISTWRKNNNKEAMEWVNASSLSEEEKKAILKNRIGSKGMSF